MTDYVITLLANPAKETLEEALVSQVVQAVDAKQLKWLKKGEACEVYFTYSGQAISTSGKRVQAQETSRIEQAFYYVLDTVALALSVGLGESEAVYIAPDKEISGTQALRQAEMVIEGHALDVIVQPAEKKAKKLLICDMDSTMITCECIDELADFVGKKAEVAAITERAMNGELDFEAALTERVLLLKGLLEGVLQRCYDERVRLMPGAKELVAHMKQQGARAVLVSGGFTFFTSRVAQALGFDAHYGNVLEIEQGQLTGRVVQPILGKEAKLATLQAQCKALGITTDEVIAIGDGANDLPMLLAAGLGVAYHAKPIVQAQAKARLNHCDLSALCWVV